MKKTKQLMQDLKKEFGLNFKDLSYEYIILNKYHKKMNFASKLSYDNACRVEDIASYIENHECVTATNFMGGVIQYSNNWSCKIGNESSIYVDMEWVERSVEFHIMEQNGDKE